MDNYIHRQYIININLTFYAMAKRKADGCEAGEESDQLTIRPLCVAALRILVPAR